MSGSDQTRDVHTRFLMGIHSKHPGLTELSIGAARTADGLSTYEVFCRFVNPRAGMAVVDLACGSGPLCGILARCVGLKGQVIGVDLSDAELLIARERLRDCKNVRFLNESAERMSLADASADLVVCHMAFMLFTPLASTVVEIGRIMKSGGAFAAVIPTLRKPTDLFRDCAGVLRAALQEECHDLGALSGNVSRMSSIGDLQAIFSNGDWDCDGIATGDIDVSIIASPEALARQISPVFYHYQLLSDDAQRRVVSRWVTLFTEHRDMSGMCSFHFPLSAFSVRKRD